jgi:hypothetical protein
LTTSSPRAIVPRELDEPTVMTEGSSPGELMVPYSGVPAVVAP